MENQNRSYFKHVAAFLGLLILIGGSYFVWDGYFSEGAKYRRQVEENMEKYNEWEKNYTKAMTEDTFGGKTPQETLDLFIDALKKEDVELASKYFLLNEIGQVDQEWVDGLNQKKSEGKLQEIALLLTKLQKDQESSSFDTVWFSILNSDGIADYSAILKLNEFSKIWKIESL